MFDGVTPTRWSGWVAQDFLQKLNDAHRKPKRGVKTKDFEHSWAWLWVLCARSRRRDGKEALGARAQGGAAAGGMPRRRRADADRKPTPADGVLD
jgi:hypothetical protein